MDWLDAVRADYRFGIFCWDERDIIREALKHRGLIQCRYPQLYSTGGCVDFYRIHSGEYIFGCNELEEVSLMAVNCSDIDDAKQKVREFIQMIRDNDFSLE
jgi:hypothetical protein